MACGEKEEIRVIRFPNQFAEVASSAQDVADSRSRGMVERGGQRRSPEIEIYQDRLSARLRERHCKIECRGGLPFNGQGRRHQENVRLVPGVLQ